jgi:lipoate-protein ligase A
VEAPVVFVHKAKQVDTETCGAMGYEVCEAYYNGGTIVADEGGIAVIHFDRLDNGWMGRFAAYFLGWLKARGISASYERNDILVDGFKVCGLCVTRYGRIDYTAGFISLNANLDHIRAICKKPMVKVPRGLSEWGITTAEVERMFLDFCKQDEN